MQTVIDINWVMACYADDVPENGGACVKLGNDQIAIFNFTRRTEWFATQNLCPHKQQMVLSRGMIGSTGDDCDPLGVVGRKSVKRLAELEAGV